MSKAFVREPDEDTPDRLPELPVPPPPNPVTAEGHRQIVDTLAEIDATLAAGAGAAERTEIARLQRERRYWAARLAAAQVTPPPEDAEEIGFGSEVTVLWPGRGEVTLRIVGEDEADPARGLIGWRAPVAVALIGNGTGDAVEVPLTGVTLRLVVLSVWNGQPGEANTRA
ncbi:GreA/GreB family elongation factor [Elioraea rosea]|uniref:GreA/GreB family elongation factor n=1 Tax=Elioraea rosea TaxID=2492390 RepID=UPI001183B896|nr:GreA/GreB family elongation factor [Elioraea rosea]